MNQKEWIHDPALSQIPKQKLHFLNGLLEATSKLSQKDMLPFLIAFDKKRRESNISFEKSELNCILEVLRKHASPEELKMLTLLASYM